MGKVKQIFQNSIKKFGRVHVERSHDDSITCFSGGNNNNISKFRRYSKKNINVLGAVHSLLETLNDKDEGVRESIERSLVRMCKRRPNETMEIICNYRQKTAKLPEAHVAVYLR